MVGVGGGRLLGLLSLLRGEGSSIGLRELDLLRLLSRHRILRFEAGNLLRRGALRELPRCLQREYSRIVSHVLCTLSEDLSYLCK